MVIASVSFKQYFH